MPLTVGLAPYVTGSHIHTGPLVIATTTHLTLPGEEKPLSRYEYSVLDTEAVVSLPGGVCLLLLF